MSASKAPQHPLSLLRMSVTPRLIMLPIALVMACMATEPAMSRPLTRAFIVGAGGIAPAVAGAANRFPRDELQAGRSRFDHDRHGDDADADNNNTPRPRFFGAHTRGGRGRGASDKNVELKTL